MDTTSLTLSTTFWVSLSLTGLISGVIGRERSLLDEIMVGTLTRGVRACQSAA